MASLIVVIVTSVAPWHTSLRMWSLIMIAPFVLTHMVVHPVIPFVAICLTYLSRVIVLKMWSPNIIRVSRLILREYL